VLHRLKPVPPVSCFTDPDVFVRATTVAQASARDLLPARVAIQLRHKLPAAAGGAIFVVRISRLVALRPYSSLFQSPVFAQRRAAE